MERGLLVELSRNEESALRRISVGIDQSEMRPRDVARLKLLRSWRCAAAPLF
jgi:hypothetical protein